jgi:hypothetical protein
VSPSTDCVQCHAAQPTADRLLCPTCTAHLHTWLVELAGHAVDLEEVVLGSLTSRRGERVQVTGSNGEAPQQWNEDASTALDDLRVDLVAIVRDLIEEGTTYPGVDRCSAMAWWLTKKVEKIAVHPAALENFDIIRHRHQQTVRVVDIPPNRVWLGRCDAVVDGAVCGQDVRAETGQRHVRCPGCMTVLNVAEFRVRVLEVAADEQLTAPVLLKMLGGSLRVGTLRQWKARALVTPVEVIDGVDVWRVGDVLARLVDEKDTPNAA